MTDDSSSIQSFFAKAEAQSLLFERVNFRRLQIPRRRLFLDVLFASERRRAQLRLLFLDHDPNLMGHFAHLLQASPLQNLGRLEIYDWDRLRQFFPPPLSHRPLLRSLEIDNYLSNTDMPYLSPTTWVDPCELKRLTIYTDQIPRLLDNVSLDLVELLIPDPWPTEIEEIISKLGRFHQLEHLKLRFEDDSGSQEARLLELVLSLRRLYVFSERLDLVLV